MKSELRGYLSLAALALEVLDWIGSLPLEYRLIWGRKFTATKFMYMVSRYGALATLSVNYAFIHIFLARGPVPPSICRGWFLFLAGSCAVLHIGLVAILILQVWAVYERNTKLVGAVGVLVGLPLTVSSELILRNIFHDSNFNEQCELRETPIEAAPLAAVYVVSHLVLWILIFRKRNAVMANDKRLMTRVVNGGNVSFVVLTTVVSGMISYCFATRSVDMIMIFIVPMVPISMLYCKTVLDMFSLKANRPSRFLDTSEVVLTSVFANSFESHELPSRISSTS